MHDSLLSVLGSIATVALIAIVTRWLSAAKGELLRKVRDGATIYGITWHWRAIGAAAVAFALVISAWSWHDLHRPGAPAFEVSYT